MPRARWRYCEVNACAKRHSAPASVQGRLIRAEIPKSKEFFLTAIAAEEIYMQQGSLIRSERKRGPDVWQFRWSEKGTNGQRVCRKRIVGTVDQYPDPAAAHQLVAGIIATPTSRDLPIQPVAMTIAELGSHFRHRELRHDDNWRSFSTRRNYEYVLERWIVKRWGKYELGGVRTIEVESWLRSLPLARSSCAKIRNLMSVLFNHAWRHELFDRFRSNSSARAQRGGRLRMC